MKSKCLLLLGIAAGVLLFVGTAHAVQMTYDFTGSSSANPLGLSTGDLGEEITVGSGGLDVVITSAGEAGATIHRNKKTVLGSKIQRVTRRLTMTNPLNLTSPR